MSFSHSVVDKPTHTVIQIKVPASQKNWGTGSTKTNSKIPENFFNDIHGASGQPFVFNRIGIADTVNEIDKTRNIESLYNYQFLEENWDGEGAKKISKEVIYRVFFLIHESEFLRQPQLSPLPDSGISMEFDLSRPFSLIIEFEEEIAVYSIVLRTEIGRLYFTGTISSHTEAQSLIYNFFNGKLPDGKTFKRVAQQSHKHKRK